MGTTGNGLSRLILRTWGQDQIARSCWGNDLNIDVKGFLAREAV